MALVWGKTLTFEFVWDDVDFIENLLSIRSLQNIPSMFYELDAQAVHAEHYKVFRPLRTMVYAMLVFLGGKETPQPWIFHLNNMLWHAAAAMLVCAVTFRLLTRTNHREDRKRFGILAAFAGAAYSVHPVVSEAVCWAKGLDDLMAAVFTLCALRILLQPSLRSKNIVIALLFYGLALYSKVSAAAFSIFVMILFLLIHRTSLWKAVVYSLPFHALSMVYLAHRHCVIGQSQQISPISGSYGQTLIDMFPIVTQYTRLLFGIGPFFIDYSYMKGGHAFFSASVMIGLLLLLLLLFLALWMARKTHTTPITLGLLWTGCFLLPVSNIVPMMQYMAERFLYLPLVGWIIALTCLLATLRRERFILTMAVLLILLWSGAAFQRASIWHDNWTLFITSTQEGPHTERVEINAVRTTLQRPYMQYALQKRQDQKLLLLDPKDRVIEEEEWSHVFATLDILNQLYPGNGSLSLAYAVAYGKSGQRDLMFQHLDHASETAPNEPLCWTYLALAYMDIEAFERAQHAIERAYHIDHQNIITLNALGRFHSMQGQGERAKQYFNDVLKLAPEDSVALEGLKQGSP